MAILANGPLLFGAYDDRVHVWFQTDAPGMATVRIGLLNGSSTVDSSTNFCGYCAVAGLEPDTDYEYTLEVDGVLRAGPLPFRTMPRLGQPAAFDLILGFDHHWDGTTPASLTDEKVLPWVCMSALRRPGVATLQVCGGDYETYALVNSHTDLSQRRAGMTLVRQAQPAGRVAYHGRVPTCVMWDDWDGGGNNNAGKLGPYSPQPDAITWREMLAKTFAEFYAGQPPSEAGDNRGVYYHFKVADCLFIMLDDRTYMDGNPGSFPTRITGADLNTIECWGAQQVQWMKDVLTANADCPFKFVINGTTIVDHLTLPRIGVARRDSIGMYFRRERNEFIQWLKDNPACARGFIWCTGDDHVRRVWYNRFWHAPVPYDSNDGLGSEVVVDFPMLELKGSAVSEVQGPPGLLNEEWDNHPDMYYYGKTPGDAGGKLKDLFPGCIKVEVDTRHPAGPRARVVCLDFQWTGLVYTPYGDDGIPLPTTTWPYIAGSPQAVLAYEFWITPDEVFLPPKAQVRLDGQFESPPASTQSAESHATSSYTPDVMLDTPQSGETAPTSVYQEQIIYSDVVTNGHFSEGLGVGYDVVERVIWETSGGYLDPWCARLESIRSLGGALRQASRLQTAPLHYVEAGVPVEIKLKVKHEDSTPTLQPVSIYVDHGDGSLVLIATVNPGTGWVPVDYPFVSLGSSGSIKLELLGPTLDGTITARVDSIECWVGSQSAYAAEIPPATAWG